MGAIADYVATMRGRSLADICAQIERMEAGALPLVLLPPTVPLAFEKFWVAYPHKVGRAAAHKAYEKAKKKASFSDIMAGLSAYVSKQDDRPWCNPATWLNQERWLDQPAIVSGPPLKGLAAERAQLQQEIANGDGRTTQASADNRHAHRVGQPDQGYEPRRIL